MSEKIDQMMRISKQLQDLNRGRQTPSAQQHIQSLTREYYHIASGGNPFSNPDTKYYGRDISL